MFVPPFPSQNASPHSKQASTKSNVIDPPPPPEGLESTGDIDGTPDGRMVGISVGLDVGLFVVGIWEGTTVG